MTSIFEAAAAEPAAPALVARDRVLSCGEIAEGAARVASWLSARGIRPGDDTRVAVVPGLDVESFVLVHALVAMGVTIVLVHPRLTPAERKWIVDDSGAALFVASPRDEVPAMLAELQAPPPAVDPSPTLAILYTSGTTGRPKGAMLSRAAFEASARGSAENLGWEPHDRWLLCMPLAHVGGLSILLRSLLARRCVVLPDAPGPFDPLAIHRTIAERRVTLVSLVPTMLRRMFDDARTAAMPPSVRAILLGGAAAPSSLVEEAAARGAPVLTTYGLTEACSQVTTQRYGTRPGVEQGSGPPMQGMEVRIAPDERIEIRGSALMSGYFPIGAHASPLTDDGWLRTEDFGRLDERGRLHVLGRRQELVVTGGENVYPVEVERVLETMPGVRACCVFGVPDATWGEIVAVAVVGEVAAGAIDAFARERLAAHKRPRAIALVRELPVAPSGKLDRRAAAAAATPLLARTRHE